MPKCTLNEGHLNEINMNTHLYLPLSYFPNPKKEMK